MILMIRKRIFLIIIKCLLLLLAGMSLMPILDLLSVFSKDNNTITSDMVFKVKYFIEGSVVISDKSYVPIKNARIILIDDNTGVIMQSGLTDEKGIWKTTVSVNRDPRFKNRKIGTITVITVADGYNETINFNVPVNEYKNTINHKTIIMNPIVAERRNEPSYKNGEFHRFTVFDMLDYYAEIHGLKKQPENQNYGMHHWSPSLKE